MPSRPKISVTVMSRRVNGDWGTRNRLTQENLDYAAERITLGQLIEIASRIKMAWEIADQSRSEFQVKVVTYDKEGQERDYNGGRRNRRRASDPAGRKLSGPRRSSARPRGTA